MNEPSFACSCPLYNFYHIRSANCFDVWETPTHAMAAPTSVPASREPEPFDHTLSLSDAINALLDKMEKTLVQPPTFHPPRWASARWPSHQSDVLKLLNELETR
jgi:hypothetical protein